MMYPDGLTKMHNKEQHAKNGNVDRVDDVQADRSALIQHLKTLLWDSPPIGTHEYAPVESRISDAERYLFRNYYSDQIVGAHTYHVQNGTLHQYLSDEINVSEWLLRMTEINGYSTIKPPQNVWVMPSDIVTMQDDILEGKLTFDCDTFETLDNSGTSDLPYTVPCHLLRSLNDLKWIGVGINSGFNHGCLVETDIGVKMVDAHSTPILLYPISSILNAVAL